jgi:Na+-driven multidrug efflux pump
MKVAALSYLKYRAFGVPAATVLLVTTSIFRGRGDTKTPLYCTSLGNLVNIVLDPILIFSCNMGCSGAGAATAISQWVTAIPLLYLLNKSIPIKIFGRTKEFYKSAYDSYLKAGGLIFLRTVAKIAAYTVTSSVAARCEYFFYFFIADIVSFITIFIFLFKIIMIIYHYYFNI